MTAKLGCELYIYWKVDAPQRAAAQSAARELQATLQQCHPLMVVRVLQREGAAATVTLMETYQYPGGVSSALAAEIEACATACLAAAGLAGVRRHMESFLALADEPAGASSPPARTTRRAA